MTRALPPYDHILAVCAHPDDESFGLGAVITAFIDRGTAVHVVCLTRGEASTLSASSGLGERRCAELDCAAAILGVSTVTVHDYPDGQLESIPLATLATVITAAGTADALLTFDHGGITGHPDHQHTTNATIAAAGQLNVPVLGWALTDSVATALNAEFTAKFTGRQPADIDFAIEVDRKRQRAAINCHSSQLADNPVPHRRLALQRDREHLRYL